MKHKLKKIIQGVSDSIPGILGGMARGMIYGNIINSNGGGVTVRALY